MGVGFGPRKPARVQLWLSGTMRTLDILRDDFDSYNLVEASRIRHVLRKVAIVLTQRAGAHLAVSFNEYWIFSSMV